MTVRLFLYLLVAVFFVANSAPSSWAQPRTYRVGLLMLVRPDRPQIKGLQDGLTEAGYRIGNDLLLEIEQRKNTDELRKAAQKYVNDHYDLIVTTGTVETTIAKEKGAGLPVVMMFGATPLESRFVAAMARPRVNVTGLTLYVDSKVYGKQLEVFTEIVPNLRRVLIFYDRQRENRTSAASLEVVKTVARHSHITSIEIPVNSLSDAERMFSSLGEKSVDGVFIVCTELFHDLTRINSLSRQKKIPTFNCALDHVYNGGLAAYFPDLYQLGRRAAWYVDRILKGTKPQDLPVETPKKFELVINLGTANAIGLNIPPEVLQGADKVVR